MKCIPRTWRSTSHPPHRMAHGRLFGLLCLILTGGCASPAWPQRTAADAVSQRCTALLNVDFSVIQDAPTQITGAKVAEAVGDDPAYCQVQGYVWPQVGFELRLPLSKWNGKFFQVGCGGSCGNLHWTTWCPLHRGYACIVSDMGHKGGGQYDDTLWAYNNIQAHIDWGLRSTHVVALAGKAVTQRYYGTTPDKSYFMGCSTGGKQGLTEAQLFPWDFNGIIAIAGVPYQWDNSLEQAWRIQALVTQDGRSTLSQQELKRVHDAALARCDMDDGIKDGLIGNPYHCKFDPSELLCKSGAHDGCLSASQIDAVKKAYAGPMTSRGEKKAYLRGMAAGSELGWTYNALTYAAVRDWFRYLGQMGSPGSQWTLSDLNFDLDYRRFGVQEALAGSASNPDLRKFKEAGGKLIAAHGWNDEAVTPAENIDYYELAEKTMGGRKATQDFYRLFMVPGMKHCTGGDGAFAIDYLTALENWVERGQAPDKLMGAHVSDHYLAEKGAFGLMPRLPLAADVPVDFTRPVYPYPFYAKYKGRGDPGKAQNFKPAAQ